MADNLTTQEFDKEAWMIELQAELKKMKELNAEMSEREASREHRIREALREVVREEIGWVGKFLADISKYAASQTPKGK